MRTDIFGWARRGAAPALLAFTIAGGCDFFDAETGPYLTLGFARTQPATADLGVVVVLQQRGGSFLRLRTTGGALQTSTTAGAGADTACVPLQQANGAEPGTELLFFTVKPEGSECVLFADLLNDGDACSGEVLESRVLAVSRERATQPEPEPGTTTTGTSGSAGSTASGGTGTGGTTTSSGGATSTAGGGTGGGQ